MKKIIKKFLSMRFIRYGLSSLMAFTINYVILLVLDKALSDITLGLEIAATVGWIVSSNVNFFVNRKAVFHDKGKVVPEYLKYYSVAIPVFLIKNLGLFEIFVRLLNISAAIASPLAETVMFILTYFIQKFLVFNGKKKLPAEGDTADADNSCG